MVVIALVLILLGALAIVFAFAFTDAGTGGTYLGVDVNILSAFLIGVAAGAAIVWGLWILKWGTKRTPGPPPGAQGAEPAQRQARARRGRAPRGRRHGHGPRPHLTHRRVMPAPPGPRP